MKHIVTGVLALLFTAASFAQERTKKDFNLDFETISENDSLPQNWVRWNKEYTVAVDPAVSHSGKKSVLIEATSLTKDGFEVIAQTIPNKYKGRVIVLRGWIKLENVQEGFAGLFLRIDGNSGTLQFDNMQDQKIKGSADWKQYSIYLDYNENEAESIVFGALNTGTGKVWVDDLILEIDGKEVSTLEPQAIKEYNAQKDKEFEKSSALQSIALTDKKTEDLKVLGLVWGYLKYYHPQVAAGNYNWDFELFRILPKILASVNTTERDTILYKWINGLGKFEKGKPKKAKPGMVMQTPGLEWIETSGFSAELKNLLLDIKNAKRDDFNYYVGFHPNVENPEFKHENAYTGMAYPDAGYRMLALYRYWNIIQYYFPNRHLIEGDWKNILAEFIPRFANAASETDYKVAVLELIAKIHDTHANVWSQDAALKKFRGENYAAPAITFIQEQAVVTGFYDEALGKESGLEKGDVVTAVNNKKIPDFVKEQLKYTPASNYPTQLRDIAKNILRTNDASLTVEYKRGNQILTKTIAAYPTDEINIYSIYEEKKKDTCFKFITPKIAYLYPGTIKNEYLPKILKDIESTDGLVIDLRCYPSDFIVFTLGNAIVPKKTDFVKFSTTNFATPGLFSFTKTLAVGGAKNPYKGKVVILINETSQSNAEYTTMALRAGGATVIGSTTAGADGNVSDFKLPGGIRTLISGIGVYYPDGKETQRIGIVPDIEVKPTVKGFQAGKDEVLDKALELISK